MAISIAITFSSIPSLAILKFKKTLSKMAPATFIHTSLHSPRFSICSEPTKGLTLADALQFSEIPDADDILGELRIIQVTLDNLIRKYHISDMEGDKPDDSDNETDEGGAGEDGSDNDDDDKDIFRKYGFTDLNLGKLDQGQAQGKQREPRAGGRNRVLRKGRGSISSLSYKSNLPREGDLLMLQPCNSLTDAWSFDDSDDGEVAPEPHAHDFSLGPSPAQLIVLDWRCRRDSSSVLRSSISNSSTLLHNSTISVASSPSVITLSSSSINSHPPPKSRDVVVAGPAVSDLLHVATPKSRSGTKSGRVTERGRRQATVIARRFFPNLATL